LLSILQTSLQPAPDENGNCPDGFGHTDDDQCIPIGDCPSGYVGRELKDCPGGERIHKDWECPITISIDEFGNPKCDELRDSTDPEVVDFDVWDDIFSEGVPVCDNVTVQRCQVALMV
jgi:hypothetical protein